MSPSQRLLTMRSSFVSDDFLENFISNDFLDDFDDNDISYQPFIAHFLHHVLAIYILIAVFSSLALFIKGLTQQRERNATTISQQISEAFDYPTSELCESFMPMEGWAPISESEGELSFGQLQLNSLESMEPSFVDLPQTVRFRAGQGGKKKELDKTCVGEKRKDRVECEPVKKRRMS